MSGSEWQTERTLRTDTTASEHRTGAPGERTEKFEVGDDPDGIMTSLIAMEGVKFKFKGSALC